jgi:hypothetical protein
MFVSGFYFLYSYFVYLHFFLFLCIYLFIYFVSIFFFKKILVFLICSIMKIYIFFNCIFVWLDAGPSVFPKDFFNRNGTSPGPPQWLPWPPCPALPLPYPICHHKRTDKQTPHLLLYIRLHGTFLHMLFVAS